MAIQYVVALGDPFNGIKVHGPFSDYDSALMYAEEVGVGIDWHVVQLESPGEESW